MGRRGANRGLGLPLVTALALAWLVVAPAASTSVVGTPARSGREIAFSRALRFHYGSEPSAFAAFQEYEHVVALADANDTMSGASLCGMAMLLETGGGRSGNLQPDLLRAVSLYNASAALGNATAQFAVAVLYNNGILGFPHNEPLGLLYLHRAALGGEAAAQLAMGYRHLHGVGVPKKCASAVVYYELAANAAVDSMTASRRETLNVRKRLDAKYLDGFRATSAESRDEELVNYYVNTADRGDVKAQVALGQLHYYGAQGVPQDLEKAAQWFTLAADQGDPNAQADLGHMYLHGLGVEQDATSAKALFSKAAERGVSGAINGLGYMYLTGRGMPKSYPNAKEQFKRAAESGNADALFNLGLMYLDGMGTRREFSRAQSYFSRAAQRSHLHAQHKMAQMHVHGVGTARSCQKAVKLFMLVARRGPWVKQLDQAYHRLLDGQAEEAFFGYVKAAEQGYEVAQWNAAFMLDHGLAHGSGPGEPGFLAADPDATALSTSDGAEGGSHGAVAAPDATAQGGGDAEAGATAVSGTEAGSGTGAEAEAGAGATAVAVADDGAGADERLARIKAEERALRLFLRSSQQGFVEASLRVGDYYYYGKGGLDANAAEAATHYHKAADMRNPQAMFNLGYMHEHGEGVTPDPHLAKRFYDMSVETYPKAYFAVKLAMLKMRLSKWWDSYWAQSPEASSPGEGAEGHDDDYGEGQDVGEDDDSIQPGDADEEAGAVADATDASGGSSAKPRKGSAAKRAMQRVRQAFASLAGAGTAATGAAQAAKAYVQTANPDDNMLLGLLMLALLLVLLARRRLQQ